MVIQDQEEAAELIRLVNVLAEASESGIEINALVKASGVSEARLLHLADRHPEYLVRVGTRHAYALNRFGTFRASAKAILKDIEREESAYQGRKRGYSPIIWLLFGWLIGGASN